MLPGLYDVYVLSAERSASILDRFLTRFAPQHEESADDFAVQDASQEHIFDDSATALAYCVAHAGASASFYWRSLQPPPDHVMAFFTSDGSLILGLSTSEDDASRSLVALRAFVGGSAPGYICFEQPPPTTTVEFLAHTQAQ